MYEVSTHELIVFVVLGFSAGIFSSIFLARFLEVVHTWKLVQETVVYLLFMCSKIAEDVAFLEEVKRKHMHKADFTREQIREFQKVDEQTLTNWKNSVILSIVKRAPPHFRSMLPFRDWQEAMKFMDKTLRHE